MPPIFLYKWNYTDACTVIEKKHLGQNLYADIFSLLTSSCRRMNFCTKGKDFFFKYRVYISSLHRLYWHIGDGTIVMREVLQLRHARTASNKKINKTCINPLKPELNSICYLLALLGAHQFLHVSKIRVKLLTFRLLMSYIHGASILDVSRSHTTTQHSR